MVKKVFLIVFAFISLVAHPQLKQDSSRKVNILPLPLIFRSPETNWAFGLSGSATFKTTYHSDNLTRTSTIQLLTLFTTREQNIQALDATIYFPKEKYVLYVQASHSYFPDRFWGLGPNTDNNYEKYRFQQVFGNVHLKRRLFRSLFGGAIYEYQSVFGVGFDTGGKFDTSIVYGRTDHWNSGFGISLGIDTRNSGFWPTKGYFIQTLMTYFNTYFGGQYNDLRTIIDFRFYQKLWAQHVLATQIYSYSNSGQPTLRELAALGGASNLRGFYQGRFRDNSLVSVIAEYRAPIWERFAITLFGGVGNVYNELDELKNVYRNIKYSWGGGVRVAILKKERLNLRLDYGYYDKHNKGFYFTIGECF